MGDSMTGGGMEGGERESVIYMRERWKKRRGETGQNVVAVSGVESHVPTEGQAC